MNPTMQPLLQELEQEQKTTRRVLEAVPAEKFGWKPHPRSMSLGELAFHIATTPRAIGEISKQDVFDFATMNFTPPTPESKEQLLHECEASGKALVAELSSWDEARASSTWTAVRGSTKLMAIPRISLIRSIAMNHIYHHRGQLTVYLRLLDIPVPSVYGPSADENPFA